MAAFYRHKRDDKASRDVVQTLKLRNQEKIFTAGIKQLVYASSCISKNGKRYEENEYELL